jgi:hypothetical protein
MYGRRHPLEKDVALMRQDCSYAGSDARTIDHCSMADAYACHVGDRIVLARREYADFDAGLAYARPIRLLCADRRGGQQKRGRDQAALMR